MNKLLISILATVFLFCAENAFSESEENSIRGVSLGMSLVDAFRSASLSCHFSNRTTVSCDEGLLDPESFEMSMYLDSGTSNNPVVKSISFRICSTDTLENTMIGVEQLFNYHGDNLPSQDFSDALTFNPNSGTEVVVRKNGDCTGKVDKPKPSGSSFTVFYGPKRDR